MTGPEMTGAEQLVRAARAVRWYVRGVVGADAFERYLEHHQRVHPDVAPMSEKQFWRAHIDDRDKNPRMRCC